MDLDAILSIFVCLLCAVTILFLITLTQRPQLAFCDTPDKVIYNGGIGVFSIVCGNNWGQTLAVLIDLPLHKITQKNSDLILQLAMKTAGKMESTAGWQLKSVELLVVRSSRGMDDIAIINAASIPEPSQTMIVAERLRNFGKICAGARK